MNKCTNCLGSEVVVREVCDYDADLLGAPFRVILADGVQEVRCASCDAKLETIIPDLEGLLRSTALRRALEPRRLNGAEIKFLRNAMGWKSKRLAQRLDLSAEHLSRCENGVKQLSATVEKWLRLFVLYEMVSRGTKAPQINVNGRINIDQLFDMNLQAVWDPRRPLIFRFHRCYDEDGNEPFEQQRNEGDWELQAPVAVASG